MPKLVTVLRPEKIEEQARYYVRSHILLPAGTVGLAQFQPTVFPLDMEVQ